MNNILSWLTLARENRDPDALEKALYFENQRQFDRSHTNILCTLLSEDWHSSHEDILMTLDFIRDPESVSTIVASLTLELSYFTGNEIPRKAIWALRSINSPESFYAIQELTKSDDDFIREHALLNLKN